MKDSKQSFKDLVKKMDSLEETRCLGFVIRDYNKNKNSKIRKKRIFLWAIL